MNYRLKHMILTAVFFILCANACAMIWLLLSSTQNADNVLNRLGSASSTDLAALAQANGSEGEPMGTSEPSVPPLTWVHESEFQRTGLCYQWSGLGGQGREKAQALILSSSMRNTAWFQKETTARFLVTAPLGQLANLIKAGYSNPYKANDLYVLGLQNEADSHALAKKLSDAGVLRTQIKAYDKDTESKFVIMPKSSSEVAELQELTSKINGGHLAAIPCPAKSSLAHK